MTTLQTFIKSLYSAVYIGRFRFKSIGKTIGYIFFLMIAASIPAAITLTVSITGGINQLESALTHDDMPAFTISGRTIDSGDSASRDLTDDSGRRIVFDPEGTLSEEDIAVIKEQKQVTAFLEDEFVLNTRSEQRSFAYSMAGGFTISKNDMTSLIQGADGLLFLFIPVTILLMYLFTTALKFIGISFLSVYGLMIRRRSPVPLSYRQIWIMCAYAVTLPTMVVTVVNLFPGRFPDYQQNILYWFTAFVWLAVIYSRLPVPKKKRQQ
ncbi:DUF1189 domain-containing protein [Salibacterium halotolerans]|uniref:Maltodextrin utilization protein YvdJ n=1 Tax=Salibacterium halotolerans TaxID=1884432 RepID=A0A1I5NIZ9_9BACI|nr:DUF1189 domain-containing protein [Salibacterium halotolerans]SFP21788.1 Protein of unknown function [Salibacterium halotolerans]